MYCELLEQLRHAIVRVISATTERRFLRKSAGSQLVAGQPGHYGACGDKAATSSRVRNKSGIAQGRGASCARRTGNQPSPTTGVGSGSHASTAGARKSPSGEVASRFTRCFTTAARGAASTRVPLPTGTTRSVATAWWFSDSTNSIVAVSSAKRKRSKKVGRRCTEFEGKSYKYTFLPCPAQSIHRGDKARQLFFRTLQPTICLYPYEWPLYIVSVIYGADIFGATSGRKSACYHPSIGRSKPDSEPRALRRSCGRWQRLPGRAAAV